MGERGGRGQKGPTTDDQEQLATSIGHMTSKTHVT